MRIAYLLGILLTVVSISQLSLQSIAVLNKGSQAFTPVFQKGMSYATCDNPSSPNQYNCSMSDESLKGMRDIGVEWVAIDVVWYQENTTTTHIYPNVATFSPTNDSVRYVIRKCHELGMKVMLKPMINCENGSWRAYIQPIPGWFSNYTAYVCFFAEMAEECNAEMFCIGCELRNTTSSSYTKDWENIISEIRKRYHGNITYAADWGKEYDKIEWWDYVDYVGINAYFGLTYDFDPSIEQLKLGWHDWIQIIEEWQSNKNISKPIIFTEIGYQAVNGTSKCPWDFTIKDTNNATDLQEQVDCYEAAFQELWNETWLHGMYWWYWRTDPNPTDPLKARGNVTDALRDYTPQGKPAQGVLTHWYSQEKPIPESPSALVLPLLMVTTLLVATLLATIAYRRKYRR